MQVRVSPSAATGVVDAPPSKSMAHRALIAAALAQGESCVRGVGSSADICATIRALDALGARVHLADDTATVVGCDSAENPGGTVFCAESGSTLRFLLPLFALGKQKTLLTGAGRLPERPQSVYAALFAEQQLPFAQTPEGVALQGPLKAGDYTLRGDVSSQFITGLLFALPLCAGDSVLHILPPFESASYVGLTLATLREFGVRVTQPDAMTFCIPGGQHYLPRQTVVEGDYSGAAFFALLGALCGTVECRGLHQGRGQGDAVFFDFLQQLGAKVALGENVQRGICVTKAPLHGGVLDLADCPDLGPAAMVLGCFTNGGLLLKNTARLRYKESDRAAAMQQELGKLGFLVETRENEIWLPGARTLRCVPEYTVSAHGDHRIAMALAVCAAALEAPVVIDGAESVEKSYPDFWSDLAAAGIKTEVLA